MTTTVTVSLRDKILEQIERAGHLIDCLPADSLSWSPPMERAWTTARVLGHLVECVAGFCAVLCAARPEQLAHFQQLRNLCPAGELDADEVRSRLRRLTKHIVEGFGLIDDKVLGTLIPTVFVPEGEPVMTLLLGNLEHLINHKHQLFTYLRLMHVEVTSQDLYRFR